MERRAFTLIELLVMISIVAILATLLLLTIRIVRNQASTVNCSSNLRQLGLAVVGYANDGDGLLPVGYTNPYKYQWPGYLAAYINDTEVSAVGAMPQVFRCPSASVVKGTQHYTAQFHLFPDMTKVNIGHVVRRGNLGELRADMLILADGTQDPGNGNASSAAWNQLGMWEWRGGGDDPNVCVRNKDFDSSSARSLRFRHGDGRTVGILWGDLHVAQATSLIRRQVRCNKNGRKAF